MATLDEICDFILQLIDKVSAVNCWNSKFFLRQTDKMHNCFPVCDGKIFNFYQWLTNFAIFFSNWFTKFAIIFNDRLTECVIFFHHIIGEIHDFFPLNDRWNSRFFLEQKKLSCWFFFRNLLTIFIFSPSTNWQNSQFFSTYNK